MKFILQANLVQVICIRTNIIVNACINVRYIYCWMNIIRGFSEESSRINRPSTVFCTYK